MYNASVEEAIQYKVTTHPRVKGVKLKIVKGELVIVSRRALSERQYADILRRNHEWVKNALSKLPAAPDIWSLTTLDFIGKRFQLQVGPEYDFLVDEVHNVIYIQKSDAAKDTLNKWMRRAARRHLLEMTDGLSARHKLPYNKLSIRDQGTRWGSCSTKKNINLSWRLALAPAAVAEYVIVHELAHTVNMDHSSNFWGLVEKCMPDYRTHRHWLKRKGQTLYFI